MKNNERTTKEKILKEENHTYSNKKGVKKEMPKTNWEEAIFSVLGIFLGIIGVAGLMASLTNQEITSAQKVIGFLISAGLVAISFTMLKQLLEK